MNRPLQALSRFQYHALGTPLLIGFLAGLAPSCAGAQATSPASTWPPPDHSSGSLGEALETQFHAMLANCGISNFSHKVKSLLGSSTYPLSSIPKDIRDNDSAFFGIKVKPYEGAGASLLFRALVKDSPGVTPSIDRLDLTPGDLLPEDTVPLGNLPQPSHAKSSTLYVESCGSVVQAAAAMNLSIPFDSLKSALTSQVTTDSRLGLVYGEFVSPLGVTLSAETSPSQRLPTLLRLWNYYENHPELRATTLNYMYSFEGAAMFQMLTSARATSYTFDAQAGTAFALGAVNGNAAVKLSENESAKISNYNTYVRGDAGALGQVTFSPLPSPQAIADAVSRLEIPTDPPHPEFLEGQTTTVRVLVQPVPATGWCENRWGLDPGTVPLTIDVTASYDPAKLACTLTNVMRVTGSFANAKSLLKNGVSYKLTTDPLVVVDSGIARSIRLGVTIHFQPSVSDFPRVALTDGAVRQPTVDLPVGGASPALEWSVPIAVEAANSPVIPGQTPTVEGMTLTCPTGGVSPLSSTLASALGASSMSALTVKMERRDLAAGKPVGDLETCTINGTIGLALSSGENVKRPLPSASVASYKPVVATPKATPSVGASN